MFLLQELMQTMNSVKVFGFSPLWRPFLLTLLHFYVVLVYAPFGICSIWNIIRYGLFVVYEDPARFPAYFLIFMKCIRFGVGRMDLAGAVCFVVLWYLLKRNSNKHSIQIQFQ